MVILLQNSDSTGTLVSLNDVQLRKSIVYQSAVPPPLSLSGEQNSSSRSCSSRTRTPPVELQSEDHECSAEASSVCEDDSGSVTIQLHRSALFLPDIDECENDDRENDDNRWYASDEEEDNDDRGKNINMNNKLGASMDTHSDTDSSCYFSCSAEPRPLYLPLLNGSTHHGGDNDEDHHAGAALAVDEYLPVDVLEAAEDLLAQPVQHFSSQSRERVLYVAQGEIAHAVPLQCDVIMSDRSTTCHILALRSYSDHGIPLTSLAHVDDTCYEDCLRDVVARHYEHHSTRYLHHSPARRFGHRLGGSTAKAPSPTSSDAPFIRMDVHMVGGFVDPTSRGISNFLLYGLATIAAEYYDDIKFTLQTCAISSLNGTNEPVGRSLAIDMRTGRPFLARADPNLIPGLDLRSARLFQRKGGSHHSRSSSSSSTHHRRRLACIHDQTSNDLVVSTFAYEPCFNADVLLSLDDDLLLRCTSTSPHCEDDDFCASLRSTLQFLRDVPATTVFGKNLNEPIVFKRAGRTNKWRCLQQPHMSLMSSTASSSSLRFW